MNYLIQRRANLVRHLKEDGVDAYLLTNPVNITYLSGFTGDSAALLVTAKNTVLISDSRFEEQIVQECPGLDTHIRPHNKTSAEAIAEVLAKAGLKTIGVESAHLTLESLESFKDKSPKLIFAASPRRVESLRAVKDPSEVEQIRAAVRVAERAFAMFIAMVRETDTEKEMVDALDGYIRRAGGHGTSFPPIVAVGERSALPHAPPTDRQLLDGSKVIVDWGADLLYKSDITRTFRSPFGIAPTRRNKFERVGYKFDDVYELVRKAQEAAVAVIRHGVVAKDVDAAARKVFSDAGLGEFFTHGLGHGIGLEVHEAPRVRANSDDILESGMVITIEPGIYIGERIDSKTKDKIGSWGGIRLEDDFLVTKDGAIRLTTLPHDPGAIG